MNVNLTPEVYLHYQRSLIVKELRTVGVNIDFNGLSDDEIDSQKFASIVCETIIKTFNIDEDDIGIFGMLKRDLEREKATE
jgi:hypothetical protein